MDSEWELRAKMAAPVESFPSPLIGWRGPAPSWLTGFFPEQQEWQLKAVHVNTQHQDGLRGSGGSEISFFIQFEKAKMFRVVCTL